MTVSFRALALVPLLFTAPLPAQTVSRGSANSQMTTGIAPPPKAHDGGLGGYPAYPGHPGHGYWTPTPSLAAPRKPRCEQDRLITDNDPCDTNPLRKDAKPAQ